MPPTRRLKKETTEISPYFYDVKKEEIKTEQEDIKIKQGNIKIEHEEKVLMEQPVPDLLAEDLKVLFVGINPGLASAAKRHHYAGPTNHFWPCLSESGLVDHKVVYTDDVNLPAEYHLGFTNLTARASRRSTDLTLAEQREGIPILNTKIEKLRPRVACFIGKGIYEIYSNKKCKVMGLQDQVVSWPTGGGETVIFVMPSTSGIVTAYKKADKTE